MPGLKEYREEIDRIDTELLSLFERRMDVAARIAAYKASVGMPVFDGTREAEKIENLRERTENEDYRDGAEALFRKIMEISRDHQTRLIKREEGGK